MNEFFKKVSRQFDIKFDEFSKSVAHPPKSGEAREEALKKILEKYLPQRVGIDSGFVIDTQGRESKQIDIVIYDKNNATFFEVNEIKYFPCEVVIAVGEVKSNIDSRKKLEDAFNKIKSVKELDRSNRGKNLIISGPGISLTGMKFDPLREHRDQILGFIFTRTSMTEKSIIEAFHEYNTEHERRLWLNLFCAYKNFLISYESDARADSIKRLTPSAMDSKNIYCTTEDEIQNLLLLFIAILSTFIHEAHIARPNYFDYIKITTTRHQDYPLIRGKKL